MSEPKQLANYSQTKIIKKSDESMKEIGGLGDGD